MINILLYKCLQIKVLVEALLGLWEHRSSSAVWEEKRK